MIPVTRLDGSVYYLNPHLIETAEATPDVVVTLITGKKLIVREGIEDLLGRIIEYRRKIGIGYTDD